MGVKLVQHTYAWTLRGMNIMLTTPGKKIDTCDLTVITAAMLADMQVNETKKAIRHAKDF